MDRLHAVRCARPSFCLTCGQFGISQGGCVAENFGGGGATVMASVLLFCALCGVCCVICRVVTWLLARSYLVLSHEVVATLDITVVKVGRNVMNPVLFCSR